MLVTVALLSAVALGWYLPVIIARVVNLVSARALGKRLLPQKARPELLCKSHTWMQTKALGRDGLSDAKVCQACGLLDGTDTVVSPEVLDRLDEEKALARIEAGLVEEFFAQEDEAIKKYFDKEIGSGTELDKLLDVHAMGMSFHERFSRFRLGRSKQIQEMLGKGRA
jgi:hypothetical protein